MSTSPQLGMWGMLGVERDVSFQELGKNGTRFANEINQGNP